MAIQLSHLQEIFKQFGWTCFTDTERSALLFSIRGNAGVFQIVAHLAAEGGLLQLRTLNLAACPASHAHCPALLRLLGVLNYRLRLIKFAWDEDGEVCAFADAIIADGTLSYEQAHHLFGMFLGNLDTGFAQIQSVIQSGQQMEI
jgi:hypothetical protein